MSTAGMAVARLSESLRSSFSFHPCAPTRRPRNLFPDSLPLSPPLGCNAATGSRWLFLYSSFTGGNVAPLKPRSQESRQTPVFLPCKAPQLSGIRAISSAGTSTSGRGNYTDAAGRNPSPEFSEERLKLFRKLVEDIVQTSISTGPSGALRFFQGLEAVSHVGREYLRTGFRGFGAELGPPQLLKLLFERLGATYIKIGQFIASAPTLFPAEYVQEFQSCLDKTPPLPFDEVKKVIEADLGRRIGDVYQYVDPQPLASASVAQVHAARLKGSGRDVVIKVLKPGVDNILKTDLNFLYVAARLLEFLNPDIARSTSIVGIVADIRNSMLEETDFTKEAANIQAFSAYLEAGGLTRVAKAPEVFRFASSKRVLTLERLYGVPLTDLNAIRTISDDPEGTLISALNVWFGSVLACESFHADLHAGNLLVLNDGRVGFIDFGIVGRISPPTWASIQAFLASVGSAGQYRAMAIALAQMGATSEQVDVDNFALDLKALFAKVEDIQPDLIVAAAQGPGGPAYAAQLAVDERQINGLVLDLVNVSEHYGLRFPREFGLFIKQLLYFDRYTKLLAPNLNVLEDDRIRVRPRGQAYPGTRYPPPSTPY